VGLWVPDRNQVTGFETSHQVPGLLDASYGVGPVALGGRMSPPVDCPWSTRSRTRFCSTVRF